MRRICIIVCLLGILSHSILAMAEDLDMFVGEVRVLGQVKVNRVAIGQGKVIRSQVLKNGELIVIALSKGASSLHLWHKDGSQSDYNIHVSPKDPVTRVRMETMIRMKVKIVEFRKSALKKLGIDWSKEIAGPTVGLLGDFTSSNLFRPPVDPGLGAVDGLPLSVDPFSSYFGLATSITSRIHYLASTGDAVTLAEPTLSCVNGGSASFLSGGEVPYPVIGVNGQVTVEFKEYGIRLNISPVADSAGNIRTRILTEVSQVDPSVSVRGAPGLLTRRAQTEVNVVDGQTIVIAGLLNAEVSRDADKVAGLGDLPLVGGLFGVRNKIDRVTELAIFITPVLVEPTRVAHGKRDRRMLKKRRETLSELSDKLKIEILD